MPEQCVHESTIADAAARFAAGEPVLLAGADGSDAVIAARAVGIDEPALATLYGLGGGMVVIASEPGSRAATLAAPDHVHVERSPERDPDTLDGPGMAIELAHLSGLEPAVAFSRVLDASGAPVPIAAALEDPRLGALARARPNELRGLALARRLQHEAVECGLPTRLGQFRAVGHAAAGDGEVTIALVHGAVTSGSVVRSHVACLLGDTFGSLLCGCRAALEDATREIAAAGSGVLVYAKPADGDPFACPQGREVDPAVVAALLRHAGLAQDVAGSASETDAEAAA
jgi:hypothetical protein